MGQRSFRPFDSGFRWSFSASSTVSEKTNNLTSNLRHIVARVKAKCQHQSSEMRRPRQTFLSTGSSDVRPDIDSVAELRRAPLRHCDGGRRVSDEGARMMAQRAGQGQGWPVLTAFSDSNSSDLLRG